MRGTALFFKVCHSKVCYERGCTVFQGVIARCAMRGTALFFKVCHCKVCYERGCTVFQGLS